MTTPTRRGAFHAAAAGLALGLLPAAAAARSSTAKVAACENTMKGLHLTYADMLPDIGYVPAGVVELMQKQQQGYA